MIKAIAIFDKNTDRQKNRYNVYCKGTEKYETDRG